MESTDSTNEKLESLINDIKEYHVFVQNLKDSKRKKRKNQKAARRKNRKA